MVKAEIYKMLEKEVVFNAKKVSELTGKSPEYARLFLHRLRKENVIERIERDRYTLHTDPFLIASRLTWPSYISCWSALRYYNLTEQLPTVIQVITTRMRRKKKILFGNATILFNTIKPKYFFGYKKINYSGFEIFIAEKEKALIDSLLLRAISFSQLAEILADRRKEFSLRRIADYALKTKNNSLMKRFGFLLQKLGMDAGKLKKFATGRFIPLDFALPPRGKKDLTWKVIVNAEL